MNIRAEIQSKIESFTVPLLGMPLRDLNLNYQVTEQGNSCSIGIEAGFPIQYIEQLIKQDLEHFLHQSVRNYSFNLQFHSFIKAHKTQMPGKGLRGVKNTIAIASGKGGVGKSTVTVNLATALARLGARVGILDADIYGPSIPLMLGKMRPVQIKDNHYLPIQAHGVQAMSIGYLTDSSQALIWRGPMLAKSLIQMLDITLWEDLDYLFIDLPPGTGDIQLTLVQKIPLTGAIVVTTPQNVATLDAQKAISMFSKTNIDVIGVVENMSTHVCSECGHQEAIFGAGGAEALCKTFHCKLLGQLPLNSLIRQHCDEGVPTATQINSIEADAYLSAALKASIELSTKPSNHSQ